MSETYHYQLPAVSYQLPVPSPSSQRSAPSSKLPAPGSKLPAPAQLLAPPESARSQKPVKNDGSENVSDSEKVSVDGQAPSNDALGEDERVPRREQLMRKMRVLTRHLPAWSGLDWLEIRQEVFTEKHRELIPAVTSCLLNSTDNAMKTDRYVTDMDVPVDMKHLRQAFPGVKWVGAANATPMDMCNLAAGCLAPPIICVDQLPLAVGEMISNRDASRGRQIVVSLEATDFDEKGNLRKCTRKENQLAAFVCTDLASFAEQAASQLKVGESTLQNHLAAEHDAYVFRCLDAVLFRGSAEEGYPFLEKPVSIDMIISAPCCERPRVKVQVDRSQWYVEERHHVALLERLNLIGFAAYEQVGQGTEEHAQKPKPLAGFDDDEEEEVKPQSQSDMPSPVLVLSAFGCLDGGKHPFDALGIALKHWRQRYSGHFHSVFLACGDARLANRLDRIVNSDIYAAHRARNEMQTRIDQGLKAVSGAEYDLRYPICRWHWNPDFVDMSVTRLLTFIGRAERKLILEFGNRASKLPAEITTPHGRMQERRKSSGVLDMGEGLREALNQARKPSVSKAAAVAGADDLSAAASVEMSARLDPGRGIGELKDAFNTISFDNTAEIVSPNNQRRMSRGAADSTPSRQRRMSMNVPSVLKDRWEKEKKEKENKAAAAATQLKPIHKEIPASTVEDQSPTIPQSTRSYMRSRLLKKGKDKVEEVKDTLPPAPQPEDTLQHAQKLAASVQEKVRSKAEWAKLFKDEEKYYSSRARNVELQEEATIGSPKSARRRKRGAGIFIQQRGPAVASF